MKPGTPIGECAMHVAAVPLGEFANDGQSQTDATVSQNVKIGYV